MEERRRGEGAGRDLPINNESQSVVGVKVVPLGERRKSEVLGRVVVSHWMLLVLVVGL